eukprot:s6403_g4.t1
MGSGKPLPPARRPFFVRGPQPRRGIDPRSTSWEYWVVDALVDLEGWTEAGYDISLLGPILNQIITSRAVQQGYMRHGLATVTELMQQAPCICDGVFAVGGHQWASSMESDMFWGCSGLARSIPTWRPVRGQKQCLGVVFLQAQ